MAQLTPHVGSAQDNPLAQQGIRGTRPSQAGPRPDGPLPLLTAACPGRVIGLGVLLRILYLIYCLGQWAEWTKPGPWGLDKRVGLKFMVTASVCLLGGTRVPTSQGCCEE